MGTEVTVIHPQDRICGFLDKEIGTAFQRSLKKQGLKFKLSTKVMSGTNNGEKGCTVNIEDKNGKAETIETDIVLVSIGRHAFTGGLQLEKAGVTTNDRGVIDTSDQWQTKVPSIYAIGDAASGKMLAHKAEEEGIAAIEHILGEGGHVNYNCIPGVVYTHPEVADVGLTEEQLIEQGIEYSKGVFPLTANSRARCNQDADGLVKILTDKKTDKIVGVHILGSNAGEMIAEGVLAMEYGASSEDVARTCHAHPTLSEAFKEACMAASGKPIHF